MFIFSQHIFEDHGIQVSKNLTITALALDIFLTNHLSSKTKLPLINNKSLHDELRKGYYGGLSEVYKPYGENLYYYDVNSLYPYVALESMPGNDATFIEDYTGEGLVKDNLFGFFYCKIKTTYDYLGLLPYRYNGMLVQPNGEFEGWFFSPLIKFAQENGYEIHINKGYNFTKMEDVFKSYVELIYKEKKTYKGSRRLIAKFLLNSLLGRFGLVLKSRKTDLVN